MWSEEKIQAYLKDKINEKRFIHSLGVRDTAINLSLLYGEDVSKVRIAALVHDCAKNMSDEDLTKIVKDKGYRIDSVCKKRPQLLHGLAGAIIANNKMEIKDEKIFDAVRYHTTGKRNMNRLEKIIYLADYIEPSRDFPGVVELRKLAYEDLNAAVFLALESTIRYVMLRDEFLHMDTIHARNYLLCRKQE